MEYIENKTFGDIQVEDTAYLDHTLTEHDIKLFATVSGDWNPAHVDKEFAKHDIFHKIVGHGMWTASLISAVLGMKLPGPGTIYVSQTLNFKKPVAIGDTIRATVTVREKNSQNNQITLWCECTNQQSEIILNGRAEVLAPQEKIRWPKTKMPTINLP